MDPMQRMAVIDTIQSLTADLKRKADQMDRLHRQTNELRKGGSTATIIGSVTAIGGGVAFALAPATAGTSLLVPVAVSAAGTLLSTIGALTSAGAVARRVVRERHATSAFDRRLTLLAEAVPHCRELETTSWVLCEGFWQLSQGDLVSLVKSIVGPQWKAVTDMYGAVSRVTSSPLLTCGGGDKAWAALGKHQLASFIKDAMTAVSTNPVVVVNVLFLIFAVYEYWDADAQLQEDVRSDVGHRMRRVVLILEKIVNVI